MNDQINVLLEVLEEIKQQNRELKASIFNLPQPTKSQGEIENRKNLAGIAKILEEQLEFHRQFREELCQVIAKLGECIHEMKSGIAEVRISQDEATDKLLTELQTKQTTPEIKLSKYYLFDVKRWAEWLTWGVMVAVLPASSVGQHISTVSIKPLIVMHSVIVSYEWSSAIHSQTSPALTAFFRRKRRKIASLDFEPEFSTTSKLSSVKLIYS